MKTRILLAVCLALAGISAVSAQNGVGTVLLHHEGNVTVYWGNRMQEAVNASVKGDTLYLSKGIFTGFDVPHGIVVIGSGEETIVTENITITGNDENKDLGGYVFSGLNLLKDFVVKDGLNGFRMNQCQMNSFDIQQENKAIEDAEISMSFIKHHLQLRSSVQGLVVTNSKIYAAYNGGNVPNTTTFHYCNVGYNNNNGNSTLGDSGNNTFYNSIVERPGTATCINSLYYSCDGTILNSWNDLEFNVFYKSTDMNSPFSDEELREKGYISSDGSSVVGITGGPSPYTLTLAGPQVIDHKIDVDNVSRTVKVTLQMSGNSNGN